MITELMDGALALVRQELPQLKKCEDLPSRKALETGLDQLLAVYPAVYAIYEGGAFGREIPMGFRQPANPVVLLAVIAGSLRDSTGQAAMRGEEGAYQILDALRRALLGKAPATGFGLFAQEAESLYAVKGGKVVYLASYRTTCDLIAED